MPRHVAEVTIPLLTCNRNLYLFLSLRLLAGIAMDTPKGLLVPVIRHVQLKVLCCAVSMDV